METSIEQPIAPPQVKSRRFTLTQIIAYGIVGAIVVAFAVGLQMRGAKPVEKGLAPQFTLPLYSGEKWSLADQRGKVVVVNFWASWCVPCREEAPVFESTWRQYKDRGVVFVGVDYVDSETEARKFIEQFGITYANGPDVGTEAAQKFHIQGVPETYFVGKDGQLAGNRIGVIDAAALSAKLDELLQK